MTSTKNNNTFVNINEIPDIIEELSKEDILQDYYIAFLSRQLSIVARKEVLSGKAKFGIFGDGKEIAQIAYAKQFKEGDWRAGYYRDQTFMLAAGLLTPKEFFALLYGDTDISRNPHNGGRSFNNHFATRSINSNGEWNNICKMKNSSSDISPTAGHMPRLLGLAYASKLFKKNKDLHSFTKFSNKGNEVAFGMIGEGSTSEGHFFEAINAAGVLQVPMALAVWDDGYGISVPVAYQTTKQSISEALHGFSRNEQETGILIFRARGWNYPELLKVFKKGIELCRKEHVPVVFHITELTQPTGHSTSGSHERYKSKERLDWEKEYDALEKMKQWMFESRVLTHEEISEQEEKARKIVNDARKEAWNEYTTPLFFERNRFIEIIENRRCKCNHDNEQKVNRHLYKLKKLQNPIRRDLMSTAKRIQRYICLDCTQQDSLKSQLQDWLNHMKEAAQDIYSSLLYCENDYSALKTKPVNPIYEDNAHMVNGREILNRNFDYVFSKNPLVTTFGEDTGKIGDVNSSLSGLQDKYGELRITDTGIREATIIGQAIGMALRGLRPIPEIQYIDYLLYAVQTLSDDLATTNWRTCGGQVVPVIIRTRGHRLEGIWHSGSPMSMILSVLKGIYLCVPRNMTQAAGFYNTLLQSQDPALVVEPLNGYQVKEKLPSNIGEFRIPLGIPEILVEGSDITLVTYGSCVRIALDAVEQLKEFNISVELIDVQTLQPFDINHVITESIRKTSRVIFFDEDVPGGGTAYMMQKVLEEQNAYNLLDSNPVTLSAKEHRPAYSSDGDYFSNPNAEDVFEVVYNLMYESNPEKYPNQD